MHDQHLRLNDGGDGDAWVMLTLLAPLASNTRHITRFLTLPRGVSLHSTVAADIRIVDCLAYLSAVTRTMTNLTTIDALDLRLLELLLDRVRWASTRIVSLPYNNRIRKSHDTGIEDGIWDAYHRSWNTME